MGEKYEVEKTTLVKVVSSTDGVWCMVKELQIQYESSGFENKEFRV
jgi:hypothetical protein